ncbi:UPF0145 protein [Thecamonas trahens ATCC 50062]|uniref:UPF0145 protein n=1 Tax=Thecamonas trahens ATCC 50062 TaxID=461836 RepID=A0A0L0DIC6_THETB|nr:UPF0145 protein [Thecamonas trahens ATCC 50062]KNC52104.1 UPF0145 protein [Thecamonas trahens ATCC 50062]|eukprot:XP_013762108.1 UPF0145 protein [Thecamonas trahens ATCC 50062]
MLRIAGQRSGRDVKPKTVLVTTREGIKGRVIEEELGIVCATATKTRSFVVDLAAKFRGLFGGEIKGYSWLINDATQEAMLRLRIAAVDMSATSVRNVRIEVATTADRPFGLYASVSVYGTAVRCESADRSPTSRILAQGERNIVHLDKGSEPDFAVSSS